MHIPIFGDFTRNFQVDTTDIDVNVNGITLPSGTIIVDNAVLNAAITEIRVFFDEDAANPANDTLPDDVTNHENYLLVRPGPNTTIDTTSCDSGVGLDDIQVPTGPVVYDNGGGSGPFVARLTVNGGTRLGNGLYRLFVCGTTSITDLAGNALNGGADVPVTFIVATRPASRGGGGSDEAELVNPATGFAPDVFTSIPLQPAELAYSEMDNLSIELPTLGIKTDITGVPLKTKGWDLTWLNNQVGWLEGTAYPTWEGNTVLTAHNYTPDGLAGPFARLKDLKYDEPIIIHNNGQRYTYVVRMNSTVSAKDSYWLNKHEELDWVTLLTCEQYDEKTKTYLMRQVVRAVLQSVESDN